MKNLLYKVVAFALLAPITVLAVSFNGRVLKTDGTPVNSGLATFTLQVYNPTLDCQLYSESKTYDFTDSQGVFSIELGSGTRLDSGVHQFTQIFSDGFTKSAGSNCSSGYTKSKGDKLILKSIFDDGQNPAFALNNVKIDYSPYSIDASSVAGVDSQNVLRVNGQQALPLSTSDYSQFLNLINGTSTLYAKNGASGVHVTGISGNPSSPTVGDLWYDTTSNQLKYYDGSVKQVGQGSAPVTSVAGRTGDVTLSNSDISGLGTSSIKDVPASGDAASGEVVLGSDTRLTDSRVPTGSAGGDLSGTYPNPTLNTITTPGKVSGSSITSGTIGGSTVFSSSGNVQTTGAVRLYDNSASNFVGFKAPASVTTSYTLTLPPSVSSGNGYVLSSDTFGNLSWTNPLNGVVAGVSGTAPVTVGGTSSAPVIGIDAATTSNSGVVTLSSDGGTTAGTVVQATDSRLTNSRTPTGSASGDLSGTYPNPTVSKIQGVPVSAASPTMNQVMKFDGTNYTPVTLAISDIDQLSTQLSNKLDLSQLPANCGAGSTLTFISVTGTFSCSTIQINGSQVSGDISGNASGFTGVLSGDIGGGQSSTVINSGVVTLSKIASSAYSQNNSASTLVQRDSSGSVQLSSVFYKNASNKSVQLKSNSSLASDITLTLPIDLPSQNGQILIGDTSGNLSWSTPASAPVTSVAGRTGAVTLSNSDISGLGTSSTKDAPASGNAASGEVVLGSDTRLTDSRVPTGSAGGDLSGTYPNPSVSKVQGVGVSFSSLTSGQFLKYDGSNIINSNITTLDVSGLGTAATKNFPVAGNAGISEVVLGSDARLTDSRTPTGSAGGDLSGTYPNPTLTTTGVGAGTYKSVTVDAKGRVTSGSNPTTLSGFGITDAIQGDTTVPSIKAGVIASRPATETEGSVYFSTDENKIYQYNTGAWATLGSATGLGGTVTSVTSANSDISVSDGTTTPSLTLNSGTGANQIVKLDATGKLPALNASLLTGITSSQVSFGSQTARYAFIAPTGGGVPTFRSLTISDIFSSVTGSFLTGAASCPSGQMLTYLSPSDTLTCQPYSITSSQLNSAMPSQTSSSGKYLTTDGSNISWGSPVVSVSSSNSDISITNGTTTPSLTLNSGTGANQIVKLDATGKLPSIDGSQLTSISGVNLSGLVKVGSDASGSCSTAGLTRYNNSTLEVCNGSAWKTMSTLTSASGAIAATLIKSSPQSFVGPGGTKITYQSTGSNTQGQASTTNSRITAGTTGSYLVMLNITISSGTGNGSIYTYITKNGGAAIATSYAQPGNNIAYPSNVFFTVDLNSGDYLESYVSADASTFTISSAGYFTMARIPSSSTTIGVDQIIEKYEWKNAQSITPATLTSINNLTKVYGTSASMNLSTGTWTSPVDGTYEISGIFTMATGTYNQGSEFEAQVAYGSGGDVSNLCLIYIYGSISAPPSCTGSAVIKLRQGEQFAINVWHNLSASSVANFQNQGRVNNFTVKRIGDY